MINPVEAQVWWPIVLGLLVLAFAIGIVVGQIIDTEKRVTSILGRELRPPRIPEPAERASERRSRSLAGVGGSEATQGRTEALSPSILGTDILGWGGVPVPRCGRPVTTSLGVVSCLMRPGHEGEC